ncbi:MAG: L-threonylcarbamoyladenylate synthase [Methanimicrococcus sp.]|nr:L-threonylcarbamoyladenylate synthase [Methanimicrococcus sp.]
MLQTITYALHSKKPLLNEGINSNDKGINSDEFSNVINETALALKSGKLAAFPTETVYGVGACMNNEKAVLEIYKIKGRPPEKPLSVLIGSTKDMKEMAADIPDFAYQLADRFWPGPMTLILNKNPNIPDSVTAGKKTIGLRIPAHPIPLELVKIAGPLACPSANLSGERDPKTAADVLEHLYGKIDILIDGGETSLKIPSTIIDLTAMPPKILRKGGLDINDIKKCIGEIIE